MRIILTALLCLTLFSPALARPGDRIRARAESSQAVQQLTPEQRAQAQSIMKTLQEAAANGQLTEAQKNQLRSDLQTVLQSSNLSEEQIQAAIIRVQSTAQAANLDQQTVARLVSQLQSLSGKP